MGDFGDARLRHAVGFHLLDNARVDGLAAAPRFQQPANPPHHAVEAAAPFWIEILGAPFGCGDGVELVELSPREHLPKDLLQLLVGKAAGHGERKEAHVDLRIRLAAEKAGSARVDGAQS
jgi:hypothetical protein